MGNGCGVMDELGEPITVASLSKESDKSPGAKGGGVME
jgi:hypothetical protein